LNKKNIKNYQSTKEVKNIIINFAKKKLYNKKKLSLMIKKIDQKNIAIVPKKMIFSFLLKNIAKNISRIV
jgi:hypothetical protein